MIKTCEFVSKKHPDKLCDRISDSILDFCIKGDPLSRVACEVMGGHGKVFITGEITTNAELTDEVIKGIVKEICGVEDVIINLVKQSNFIAQGVDIGGAGDQGIMVGYATNKTKSHMPVEYELARDLCNFIYNKHPYDGKTQVTIEDGRDSFVIKSIIASFQNTKKEELQEDIMEFLKKEKLDDKYPTELYCNMAGDWTQGGFDADAGVVGRKLCIDNYGPQIPVGGGAFCVDSKTEFLSKLGWKRIDNYKKGDVVMQYHENGMADFIKPNKYIKEECNMMYEIIGETNINQALTPNHNVVYITSKGHINKKPFSYIKELHENSKLGFSGKIIPFFKYYGKGIDLTDDEIRIQIAFMADGCLRSKRIRVLRDRKIKRLKMLLDRANYKYELRNYSDGYSYFYFTPPIKIKEFKFEYWINADYKQLKIIAEEIVMWDGNCGDIFRTSIKKNADFIQFVFSVVNNRKSSIIVSDHIGEPYGKENKYIRKSIEYTVCRGRNKYCTFKRKDGKKLKIEKIVPESRKKYCFEVPSGMLVLRRGNRIFITGNSSKDSTKVDRSGAYMARKIALELLKKHDAMEVMVKIAYCIGKAEPTMVSANIDGLEYDYTEEYKERCKPQNIIKELDLRKPIFAKTAESGHFGNKSFEWEKI